MQRPSWGKDQPNNYNGEQNCVVLDGGRGWLWNDVGCNLDYLHWICQHGNDAHTHIITIITFQVYIINILEEVTAYCPTCKSEKVNKFEFVKDFLQNVKLPSQSNEYLTAFL